MNKSDTPIVNEIEKIKDESIFTFAKLINLYGFTLSEARLFSIMFLENNPMTLDEMSQALGMSKTSMSTGVHSLLDAQMVERIWKKGIRKDLYIVEEDLYKIFSKVFIEEWNSLIHHNMKTFKKISKRLNLLSEKIDDPDLLISISKYSKKIDSIVRFYQWLEEIFNEIQEKTEAQQS